METITTDLCVIGAGAAGLSVASSAALLGVPVVLVERGAMGGDCLNSGCVPSKSLIAAARLAHASATGAAFGIDFRAPHIDGPAVMARVRRVIEEIAPIDSVARYRALGVNVITAEATFTDDRTLVAGDKSITARRFVIATGASAATVNLPGLTSAHYLTSDSLFDLTDLPTRLAILGGGAIGLELGQSFRRLGCTVSVIEAQRIAARDDAEAAEVVRRRMLAEGVQILENTRVTRAQPMTSGVALDLAGEHVPPMLNAGQLLVAVGRRARVEGLGLEKAGVAFSEAGIKVDSRQRTSNSRIFAIGDCCAERPRFTHAAAMMANVVIRNALFRQPAKFEPLHVPRVTYTDPEIAAVGLSEDEARAAHSGVQTLRWPFSENDRARTAGATAGFVKAVVDGKGRILGVTIVGEHAGELLSPWVLAMQNGLKITAMASLNAAYPTLSEASKRAAVQALVPKLRSPWVGRLIRFLRMLG